MLKASELTIRLTDHDLAELLETYGDAVPELEMQLMEGAVQISMKVGGDRLPMTVPVELKLWVERCVDTTLELGVEWTNMSLVPGVVKEAAMSRAFDSLPGHYEDGRLTMDVAELLKDRPISFQFKSVAVRSNEVVVSVTDLVVLESVAADSVNVLPPLAPALMLPSQEPGAIPEHQDHYESLRAKMAKVIRERVPKWAQPLAPWVLAVPDFFVLMVRLAKSPEVPNTTKALAAAVVAYFITPIDLLPDFLPFMGQIDDVAVALFTMDHLSKHVPEPVVREAWPGDGDVFAVVRDGLERFGTVLPVRLLTRVKNVARAK